MSDQEKKDTSNDPDQDSETKPDLKSLEGGGKKDQPEGESVQVTPYVLRIQQGGGPIEAVIVQSTETFQQLVSRIHQASDKKMVFFPPLSDGYLVTVDDDGDEVQATRHAYRSGAIVGVMEPTAEDLANMAASMAGWDDEDDDDQGDGDDAHEHVKPNNPAIPAGFTVPT
jgi:hypothetical protein